jgi:hypothetical protein
MTHKIKFATVALRISTVLYALMGPLIFAISYMSGALKDSSVVLIDTFATVFTLILAIGVEFVRNGIIQRKFWAWGTGLFIFGFYTLSIFLPLGVFGLWGLLAKGSREEFGIGVTPSQG